MLIAQKAYLFIGVASVMESFLNYIIYHSENQRLDQKISKMHKSPNNGLSKLTIKKYSKCPTAYREAFIINKIKDSGKPTARIRKWRGPLHPYRR